MAKKVLIKSIDGFISSHLKKKMGDNEFADSAIHLEAQTGIRFSIENSNIYIGLKISRTFNILEASRYNSVEHLDFALSSSVYGLNSQILYNVIHNVDQPMSLYTKKPNGLMAYGYADQFKISATGLRFFTVYCPWSRPSMANYKFTKNIQAEKPIEVYQNGNKQQDFIYVDDITESIYRLIHQVSIENNGLDLQCFQPSTSKAPCRIFNIGNNSPVNIMDVEKEIENVSNINAIKKIKEEKIDDVEATRKDNSELFDQINFLPKPPFSDGRTSYLNWYKENYLI